MYYALNKLVRLCVIFGQTLQLISQNGYYKKISFKTFRPVWQNCYKTFYYRKVTNIRDELECLSLTGFSNLV
jgi:hypothetical protein